MSQLANLASPLDVTSALGLGDYTNAANTNPALNTSAAALNPTTKGILQTLASTDPVQVYGSDTYTNITSATTTVVKSGAGSLIRIETGNAGTTNAVVIYDNTAASGTKISSTTAWTDRTRTYGVAFATGCTITTSATCDITVVTR